MKVAKNVKLLEPINVDKVEIKQDHYFPGAYIIDLPLDSTPGHIWQDIFEREWKSSRHLWDRKLFVVGCNLRLLTTSHNMKEKLEWVKGVIEQTNKNVKEYNRELKARAAQKEEQLKKQEERANVEMIRDMLRKRF